MINFPLDFLNKPVSFPNFRAFLGGKNGALDSNKGPRQQAKAFLRLTPEESQSASLGLVEAQNFSHDIFLNSNFGRSIARSFRQGVIGSGIELRSEVKYKNPDRNTGKRKLNDTVNRKIEADWKRWGRVCSRCGQFGWHEITRQVLTAMIEGGEVFIKFHDIAPENPLKGIKKAGGVPLTLQVMEADMCDHLWDKTVDTAGNYWVQGIKFNPSGRPVAYAFRTIVNGIYETREYPADNILHLFMRDEQRPNTRRGWPWVTSSRHLTDQGDAYVKAQLIHAQRAAAPNAYVIKGPSGAPVAPNEEADYSGVANQPSAAGATITLPHGSQVVDAKHNIASSVEPYIVAIQQLVAMGMGLTADEISLDVSRQNFSGLRAGGIKNSGRYSEIRRFFTKEFHDVAFRLWLSRYILINKDNRYSDNVEDYTFSWKYQRPPYFEPVKQIEAHAQAYDLGIVSKSTIAHDLNYDYESEQQQRKLDDEVAKANGQNTIRPTETPPTNSNPANDSPQSQ